MTKANADHFAPDVNLDLWGSI